MAKSRQDSESLLQVWIDAQLPPSLAGWLRTELGVDAVHVEELGLHRARDPVIFAAARDASRMVVVLTKDDDFRKLLGQFLTLPHRIQMTCGGGPCFVLCLPDVNAMMFSSPRASSRPH
ncbi:MAG TPA: DUF5615 family PIN-like protein [Terriglobia bacterium]|jgi:predicted nuclease of predicted toxin-antitoxin system